MLAVVGDQEEAPAGDSSRWVGRRVAGAEAAEEPADAAPDQTQAQESDAAVAAEPTSEADEGKPEQAAPAAAGAVVVVKAPRSCCRPWAKVSPKAPSAAG